MFNLSRLACLFACTPKRSLWTARMKVMTSSVVATIVAATVQPVFAQLPTPLVRMGFHEGTGTMTTNSGTLGGAASFAQTLGFPIFTTQVPAGAFAPAANGAAVD